MDRTFVPTTPILTELAEHGLSNLHYLPNGVDETIFNPGFRSRVWRSHFGNGEKPIILFASRLVWEKDLRVLADAYCQLRLTGKDFEFIVAGDGPARAEFEPMMPGAHFLGHQSGRALSECFASSDIFAFPSTTETFGLVTLEAMASGLVPVAADAGGAAEIVEHGLSGLLAKPHDAADLAAKLAYLLDHPERRRTMAKNAILRSADYLWSGIIDRLFASYTEIIEGHISGKRIQAA